VNYCNGLLIIYVIGNEELSFKVTLQTIPISMQEFLKVQS